MKYKTRVISGKGRGRRIEVPTLNLETPENFDYKHGIYAGFIYIEKEKHKAAIHFGPIPVFGEKDPTLEAHLIETSLDEPSEEVVFELVAYLRPIHAFKNVDDLKTQITKDIENCKNTLSR